MSEASTLTECLLEGGEARDFLKALSPSMASWLVPKGFSQMANGSFGRKMTTKTGLTVEFYVAGAPRYHYWAACWVVGARDSIGNLTFPVRFDHIEDEQVREILSLLIDSATQAILRHPSDREQLVRCIGKAFKDADARYSRACKSRVGAEE